MLSGQRGRNHRVTQTLADLSIRTDPAAPAGKGTPFTHRPPRIGIWGHYHGGNLGDELVVAALIANVRARVPDAEIVGFCQNPIDTRQRHGIPAFPISRWAETVDKPAQRWTPEGQTKRDLQTGRCSRARAFLKRRPWLMRPLCCTRTAWRVALSGLRKACNALVFLLKEVPFLRRCHRRLRGTDMLIVAGSGPLYDGWSGAWAHPYALFKWASLAQLTGTRFVCLSTGAGPLSAHLSQFFVRRAISGSWYRSYRDPSSAKLIEGLHVIGPHPVYPDMGFALDAERFSRRQPLPGTAEGRTVVGLNLMAHCDPRYTPRGDPERYACYARTMAEFAARLLENNLAVVLLYSQIQADPRVGADVREILQREYRLGDDPRLIEQPISSFACLVNLVSWCDYVIAARYHCIVLPCVLGIPVIGLAYHQKTFDLMKSMGQSEYCLDIDSVRPSELTDLFQTLQRNRRVIGVELHKRVVECRTRLAEQFDCVLGAAGKPDTLCSPLELASSEK